MELREDPEKGVFVADLTYVVVDTPEVMDRVMTVRDASAWSS